VSCELGPGLVETREVLLVVDLDPSVLTLLPVAVLSALKTARHVISVRSDERRRRADRAFATQQLAAGTATAAELAELIRAMSGTEATATSGLADVIRAVSGVDAKAAGG
jgi:hypothetical protein